MKAHRALYPVATQCRVLGVSTSGYYAWLKRPISKRAAADGVLKERIAAIHTRSFGTYLPVRRTQTGGAPRIHAELAFEGTRVGRKRVARLLREMRLMGVSRRKGVRTTTQSQHQSAAADLVNRDFTVFAPDQLWVADITYVPTWSGFLYLSVVLDAYSRRIVGWAMDTRLHTQLVLDALDMALWQRHPNNVIHHSDQGSQYTSLAFGMRCKKAGVRPSMGSVGDCFDNAMCESFFATVECELLDRHCFRTFHDAKRSLFEYIEGWYNPHRRHSALGYHSPVTYENNRQSWA